MGGFPLVSLNNQPKGYPQIPLENTHQRLTHACFACLAEGLPPFAALSARAAAPENCCSRARTADLVADAAVGPWQRLGGAETRVTKYRLYGCAPPNPAHKRIQRTSSRPDMSFVGNTSSPVCKGGKARACSQASRYPQLQAAFLAGYQISSTPNTRGHLGLRGQAGPHAPHVTLRSSKSSVMNARACFPVKMRRPAVVLLVSL